MTFLSKNLNGFLLCFAIAVPAAFLGKMFPIIGAPVFAIILGLALAGIPRPASFQGGITFTSKKNPAVCNYFAGLRHESL